MKVTTAGEWAVRPAQETGLSLSSGTQAYGSE